MSSISSEETKFIAESDYTQKVKGLEQVMTIDG